MYDISLTYSPCFLLLNIQRFPEPDIFPILVGLNVISELRLFSLSSLPPWYFQHLGYLVQRCPEANLHLKEIVTALLLRKLAPTSFIQYILILVLRTDFSFNDAKIFSVSHLNLVTP